MTAAALWLCVRLLVRDLVSRALWSAVVLATVAAHAARRAWGRL